MIFTRDFVTHENHWQIASLVTQKSLFTVTHALFFIYAMFAWKPNGMIFIHLSHSKSFMKMIQGATFTNMD